MTKKVKKVKAVGSRAQVMNGTADHTSGGLKRGHLGYNNNGNIVSLKASRRAAENWKHVKHLMQPPFKKGGGRRLSGPGPAHASTSRSRSRSRSRTRR